MNFTARDLAEISGGQLYGNKNLSVNELLTDSRQFTFTEGIAFFAIRGVNHDGYIFIEQLYHKGVKVFITEELPSGSEGYLDCAFIKVNNTINALQSIAALKRKQFQGRVIAVTGSAGKTIVKEWLADIIGQSVPVIRSPKSYNSQVGVPLSVWKLENNFTTAILEAGVSRPGEMEKLEKIIVPDIGIITNIGDAHQENFRDQIFKAEEKLKLFINASVIVYCSDHAIIHNLLRKNKIFKSKQLIDWSFENRNASVFVKKKSSATDKTVIEVRFKEIIEEFFVPFGDRASLENVVSVISVCLSSGIETDIIRTGLAGLVSVAMRMELKSGINNSLLIEDYYNSDPGSLKMALEYLKSQNNRKSLLVLSDFVQSGRDEKELYMEVASLLKRIEVSKFIGIGDALMRNSRYFSQGSRFFYSTDEFIMNFNPGDYKDEIILLKGARKFEFERIGKLFEQQVHQTLLEINLDAVAHNLNEFRCHLNNGTRIMVMVKAFAYGAGPAEIAGLLEFHRVDYLAVAYADEGVELRDAGVTLPIMVMNPEAHAFELIIRYNLEPEIYSLQLFKKFAETASRFGLLNFPVHIKIDSGMHRLGFMPDETVSLIEEIRACESLKIISVFSHLAASENPEYDDFTRKQVKQFLVVTSEIEKKTGCHFMRHVLNSSGIARFPEYQFEMVRPGIGIYGIGGSGNFNLKTTGRYKTRISQVKRIPAGDPVGYGCSDISDQEREIAVLPVGYADGLNRKLGNKIGVLFIKGSRVPIVGNICMDMCMADVTGTGAAPDDEAEIFGENISVEEVAQKCGTIPYEILTSIPPRVKRVFYRE